MQNENMFPLKSQVCSILILTHSSEIYHMCPILFLLSFTHMANRFARSRDNAIIHHITSEPTTRSPDQSVS